MNPRLYYLKNYLFDISFTLWDTVYTRPVLVESAFTGSIMVYPNPVSGSSITLQVSGMDLPANLHITDMQGRLVYGGRMEESTLHLEAGILSRAGTYVVRIACREGVIYRKLLRL